MLYPTHIAAGAVAGALVVKLTAAPVKMWPVMIVAASVAALLPDLDKKGSKATRAVPGSGTVIGAVASHRGFMHSLAAIFLISIGLALLPVIPRELCFAMVAGVISHPLVDTINPRGVQWLWPLKIKFSLARILPWPFTFSTGSRIETLVLQPALWIAAVWLLAGNKFTAIIS